MAAHKNRTRTRNVEEMRVKNYLFFAWSGRGQSSKALRHEQTLVEGCVVHPVAYILR